MLLQNRPTIEELLVKLLAKKANLSAKDLLLGINAQGFSYSLRGVYKELVKLEDEGVILKSKSTYSLHLSWLTNLLSFADLAYDTYTEPKYLEQALSLGEKKVTHRFTKVRRLDLFWIQLMSALHQIYPKDPLFLWCPYQWFYLLHDYSVNLFYQASDLTGTKRYHIIGGDNFLNRKSLESLPKQSIHSLRDGPFANQMNIYFSIVGDVCITVKFDHAFNSRIEDLFNSVKSESDLKAYDLNAVFGPDVKGSLVIENSEMKSRRLKKKFIEFFGM